MRTFIGLEPDARTKIAIEDWCHKALPASPSAVPAANFHITLLFLGDILPESLEQLETIAPAPGKIQLSANEVGYFAGSGIGFLNISLTKELLILRDSLRKGLPPGLHTSGKSSYVPHITLFRKLQSPLPTPLLAPDFKFSFDECHLFESVAGAKSRRYKRLMTFKLTAF